jgi:ubiquinone/menaquinone biosynthesis C-methylase UbiE
MVGPPIFEVLGQQLVNLVDVSDADRVLDIGCGRGAALVPATREVGAQGLALGVDVSYEMVRQTKGALDGLRSAPAGLWICCCAPSPSSG